MSVSFPLRFAFTISSSVLHVCRCTHMAFSTQEHHQATAMERTIRTHHTLLSYPDYLTTFSHVYINISCIICSFVCCFHSSSLCLLYTPFCTLQQRSEHMYSSQVI
ncbi:hypothetical protein HDV57DRAFT_116828 [Trichoderma longibrachiatum]|uniref:Uncharacterized protein n=1 Tax=Trichoderma longibrachiatum ATCC 18648 TaxID=983965 RepID=A0A2T4BU58_TRILO|nr:hypothetical protein M440DRAFT_1084948 [Trichoderma longibrachiatum ATCC 18648]